MQTDTWNELLGWQIERGLMGRWIWGACHPESASSATSLQPSHAELLHTHSSTKQTIAPLTMLLLNPGNIGLPISFTQTAQGSRSPCRWNKKPHASKFHSSMQRACKGLLWGFLVQRQWTWDSIRQRVRLYSSLHHRLNGWSQTQNKISQRKWDLGRRGGPKESNKQNRGLSETKTIRDWKKGIKNLDSSKITKFLTD